MGVEQTGTEAEEQQPPEAEGAAGFDALLDEVDAIEADAPIAPEEAPAAEAPGTEASEPAPAPEDAPPAPDATAEGEAPPPEDAATPETTEPEPEPEPEWTFRVDGRDVVIRGAKEDGDTIVIPKQAWNTQVKNYLADRAQVNRALQDAHNRIQQTEQRRSLAESQAEGIMAELDRIMTAAASDPATSFAEFEKLAQGYEARKAQAERDYWKQQATGLQETGQAEQYQRELAALRPQLHRDLQEWTAGLLDEARAAGHLDGASDDDLRELAGRIYNLLVEDADAGRIYYAVGQQPGSALPKLQRDGQRIRAVVGREVEVARKTLARVAAERSKAAKLAAAAKANADAEAKRKKQAQAAPGVSSKRTGAAPGGSAQPKNWDEVLEEVDKL